MQQIDIHKVLKLELTVDEVNTILSSLMEIPAKFCNPLSDKIRQQAGPQLESTESEVE